MKTKKYCTKLEKRLEGLTPGRARNLLKKEGIIDKEGRLTKHGEDMLGVKASKVKNHAS